MTYTDIKIIKNKVGFLNLAKANVIISLDTEINKIFDEKGQKKPVCIKI